MCFYSGKLGNAYPGCYMKQGDANMCEFCKRVGHFREKGHWSKRNESRWRHQPPRDDVKDRARDDGVHMVAERSKHMAQIKRGRDGQALPKQVAMDFEEAEEQQWLAEGGPRQGAARGKKN